MSSRSARSIDFDTFDFPFEITLDEKPLELFNTLRTNLEMSDKDDFDKGYMQTLELGLRLHRLSRSLLCCHGWKTTNVLRNRLKILAETVEDQLDSKVSKELLKDVKHKLFRLFEDTIKYNHIMVTPRYTNLAIVSSTDVCRPILEDISDRIQNLLGRFRGGQKTLYLPRMD